MKPTHQKRSYKARAVQWNGDNFDEIAELFPGVCTYNKTYLMIRHSVGISTLQHGSWIVTGENGEVKTYKGEHFVIKYEALP